MKSAFLSHSVDDYVDNGNHAAAHPQHIQGSFGSCVPESVITHRNFVEFLRQSLFNQQNILLDLGSVCLYAYITMGTKPCDVNSS